MVKVRHRFGIGSAEPTKWRFGRSLPNIIIFSRLGGWVQSTVQDDFIFEHGPRTIRPAGPQGANTLELIEELGLESKLKPIKYGHPATVNR